TTLRDRIDVILRDAMRDGRLEAILRKWDVWNDDQPPFFARVLANAPIGGTAIPATAPVSALAMTKRYVPSPLMASLVTLVLSCLSMAMAVICGAGIAIGRVYGGKLTRLLLTAYVEVMRGTPILLQLFVIYYGLAAVVRLPAFVAALIGLGLNYAAYESE